MPLLLVQVWIQIKRYKQKKSLGGKDYRVLDPNLGEGMDTHG